MEYIQVDKTRFVYRGEPIRLRGFGVGTWLNMEHFMVGLPGPEESIRLAWKEVYGEKTAEKFFRTYQETFLDEEDMKELRACGVNFIRVPFNYRLFIEDQTGKWKEDGFYYFDRLFELCRKYEIFVLMDLHTTPGAQNPDWHSDNSYGVPLFWKYKVLRDQMSALWKRIAARYYEEPALMGYDLINEPAMAGWDILNEYYKETIAAIRKVDKIHIIVLEGDMFSMDFSGLYKFQDSQLAISFHYYPTVWHPDLLDRSLDRSIRKEKIADGLEKLLDQTREYGCPVFCGEFGYGIDCGEKAFTSKLLEDTVDLLEERQLDWLLWCYKDAHFMSMLSPKEGTRWMKLVRKIAEEWSQEIEKEQAEKLLDQIKEKWYPHLTEQERYLLQFRFRACLYGLQRNYSIKKHLRGISEEEVLDMAKDFSYERCETDLEFEAYMKQVLLAETSSGQTEKESIYE